MSLEGKVDLTHARREISEDLNTFIGEFMDPWIGMATISHVDYVRDHAADFQVSVEHVSAKLRACGFATETYIPPKGGGPIVIATRKSGTPNALRVTTYGHQDVQPGDNPALWGVQGQDLSPFQSKRVGDRMYGRGWTDDKGQLGTQLRAFQYMHDHDCFPANVDFTVIVESDEESGVNACARLLQDPKYRERLVGDVVVISDTETFNDGEPALTTSLKGIVSRNVSYKTVEDMIDHIDSIHNPRTNKILLGSEFDANVSEPPEIPEKLEAVFEDSSSKSRQKLGLAVKAEEGYSVLAHMWFRPAFSPLGITYRRDGPVSEDGRTIELIVSARDEQTSLHSGVDGGPSADPGLISVHMLAALKRAGIQYTVDTLEYGVYKNSIEPKAKTQITLHGYDGDIRTAINVALDEQGVEPNAGMREQLVSYREIDANHRMDYLAKGGANPKSRLSWRIVKGQTPELVAELLQRSLPNGATIAKTHKDSSVAFGQDIEHPYAQDAIAAAAEGYSDGSRNFAPEDVHIVGVGGAIPIVTEFDAPTLLFGHGGPKDALHSPNESMRREAIVDGAVANIALYHRLGERGKVEPAALPPG